MKKLLAIFLAALMLCIGIATVASASSGLVLEVVFTSEYTYGSGDNTLTAEVRVSGNPGVLAYEIYLDIPEGLTLTGVTEGPLMLNGVMHNADVETGQLIYMYSMDFFNCPLMDDDGVIATLTLTVDESALTSLDDIYIGFKDTTIFSDWGLADDENGTDIELADDPFRGTKETSPEEIKCSHPDRVAEGAKEATCTENGSSGSIVCTFCGETVFESDVVPALGHNEDNGTVTTEPTCDKDGTKVYTCTRCGEEVRTETIPALGHDWDDGKVTKEATCEDKGETTYTCNRCGKTETKEDIDALGHDWDDGVVTTPADCLSDGVMTYTCKNDETHTKTEKIDATGHKSDLADGEYHFDENSHWLVCGNENCPVQDGIYDKEEHTASDDYAHDASGHWHNCTVCGEPASAVEEHNPSAEWTIDTTGHWHVCADCGEKLDFDAHTNAELTEAKEATASEDGNVDYWYCPDCGKYFFNNGGKIGAGPYDDTSIFVVKYKAKSNCETLGHHFVCAPMGSDGHMFVCTRNCGTVFFMKHNFNANGICVDCSYALTMSNGGNNVTVETPAEAATANTVDEVVAD